METKLKMAKFGVFTTQLFLFLFVFLSIASMMNLQLIPTPGIGEPSHLALLLSFYGQFFFTVVLPIGMLPLTILSFKLHYKRTLSAILTGFLIFYVVFLVPILLLGFGMNSSHYF